MTEDQAAQADAAIRVGFKYIAPTDKNYEGFGDSHLPAVLAGQPWTGDCDNLAATFLDYCRQECGAALEDLAVVRLAKADAGALQNRGGGGHVRPS